MADTMTTDLVLSALEMGLWRRDVVRDRLIRHSDKGSQYTSLQVEQFHMRNAGRGSGTDGPGSQCQVGRPHGSQAIESGQSKATECAGPSEAKVPV
jgi:transposase InsO family protein